MKGLYVLKEKRIYKRELPLWGSLLAAVLLAGCITLLALWCQPNALRTVLAGFKAQPLLIVLNALPIGLLLLAFAFLFRNVFYSGALVNFFVCALSLAHLPQKGEVPGVPPGLLPSAGGGQRHPVL